jgi:hypothetical protein
MAESVGYARILGTTWTGKAMALPLFLSNFEEYTQSVNYITFIDYCMP